MAEKIPSEITEIKLSDASFSGTNTVVSNLTFVNFFFGNNGCGKSTIARTIKAGHGVTYATGRTSGDYRTLVYNEDFIERNFRSYKSMPGVFTLNETNQAVQEKISALTEEQAVIKKERDLAYDALQGKKNSQADLEKMFYKDCWHQAEIIRDEFDKTQVGKKKSKQFAEAVVASVPFDHNIEKLRLLYDTAYSDDAARYAEFTSISDPATLDNVDGAEILSLSIVNSADTDFASFIRSIGATEWVRHGHDQFSHNAKGNCPYCSQPLPNGFEDIFITSFDTRYQENLQGLKNFKAAYRQTANTLFPPLRVPDVLYPKIDATQYDDKLRELKAVIQLNLAEIDKKIANPAMPIILQSTEPLFTALRELAKDFNALISENNAIVASKPQKQRECVERVFSYIAYQLRHVVSSYKQSSDSLVAEIGEYKRKIEQYDSRLSTIQRELKDLSRQTVETESAKERINLMLRDTGMHGFQLASHESVPHVYKVIRPDGSIADNLSEGEKNFIAFLYFYYLVQGMESADENVLDKIVVIDDPVSSMDSNSLFIVSTLVKDMIEVCRNNADNENATAQGNYIKQLFLLTHNAYFHQEITYSYVSRYEYVSFFLVKKLGGKSSVRFSDAMNPNIPTERINVNPVKNSYAALWEEYRELKSSVPLMNVIRKILEYYFLQLCGYEGMTLRKVVLEDNRDFFVDESGNFDAEQYQLASSMLSYISAGTVGINDGMYHVDDFMDVQECRSVFSKIFLLMKQEQHYLKMCEPFRRLST